MTMNQSTILPSEVRERIRIELERGPVSNCGDVPARSPFEEGTDQLDGRGLRKVVVDSMHEDYADTIGDPDLQQRVYVQPKPITRVIQCKRCKKDFVYVGTSSVKRFCDNCQKCKSKLNSRKQDKKRKEARNVI